MGLEGAWVSGGAALDAPDDLLAEQPLGPNQQEQQREHVREPSFDAAADVRSEEHFGKLFRGADDESADDRARNRLESAEDQDRKGLQRDEGQRELHAVARTPQHASDERDET